MERDYLLLQNLNLESRNGGLLLFRLPLGIPEVKRFLQRFPHVFCSTVVWLLYTDGPIVVNDGIKSVHLVRGENGELIGRVPLMWNESSSLFVSLPCLLVVAGTRDRRFLVLAAGPCRRASFDAGLRPPSGFVVLLLVSRNIAEEDQRLANTR